VARRVGYVIAAAVNAAILYAVFVWPGWREVPFLTEETTKVLGIFTVSLMVGIVVNVAYLVADPPLVRAIGELVTTAVGVAVLIRVWQVFPFDFTGYAIDWAFAARIVLVVAIAGSILGLLIQLFKVARRSAASD
jgi:hypothetical protein